jgi:hypothetical protein
LGCSRWTELGETLRFHGGLAHLLHAKTEFRLLNGSDPILVGDTDDSTHALETLNARLVESPQGKTPLCSHLAAVVRDIQRSAEELRRNHQRAVVVIATDGEASDGSLVDAMKPLEVRIHKICNRCLMYAFVVLHIEPTGVGGDSLVH